MALPVVPLALTLLLQPAPYAGSAPDTAYTGAARRDPFARPQATRPAPCSDGLSCLPIDAVEIRGTIRTPKGWAALLASGGRSYLVKSGDTLLDGDVTEVSAIHVTFRQVAQDPLAPGERAVVKSLRSFAARLP